MKLSWLNRLFAGALVLAHLLLISCDKNPAQPEQKPPSVPPAMSMKMDLNTFTSPSHLGKANEGEGAIGLNFITARATVALINASVTLVLSIPAYVLAAALTQQPTLNPDDGKFHWVIADQNKTFQADLAGWIDQGELESRWEMRITAAGNNPPLNNFLWFEGRAKLDNSSGYWDIYDANRPATANQALHIEWQIPSATHAMLQFTAVDPNSPDFGDQLTYRTEGSLRWITHFDKSENRTVEISWDETTHAGYLIAPGYNNGQKSCWDSQLNDVVCTP